MKSHVLTEHKFHDNGTEMQANPPKKLCACWLFKGECQKSLLTEQQEFLELWPFKDTAMKALFSPHWEARSWMVMQVVYTISNQWILLIRNVRFTCKRHGLYYMGASNSQDI
jgi:hypothetical protein